METKLKIGLVSIGRSLREDIVQEMRAVLGDRVDIIQRGALDGLSSAEIDMLRVEGNDVPLITRIDDTSTVVVGRSKILPLVQNHVDAIEQQGAEITAILCTGDFSEITARKICLLPSQILFNTASSILRSGKLCVIVPMEEQRQIAETRWQNLTGLAVFSVSASPYKEPAEMNTILHRINKENPDLIILDCMGYTIKHKEYLHAITGKPVLLPRSLLLQVIKELLCV